MEDDLPKIVLAADDREYAGLTEDPVSPPPPGADSAPVENATGRTSSPSIAGHRTGIMDHLRVHDSPREEIMRAVPRIVYLPIYCLPIFLLTGCYTYAPIPVESAPPGVQVRARLSPVETVRIQEALGTDRRVFDGALLDVDEDSLLLQVPVPAPAAAGPRRPLFRELTVPRGEVIEIEFRRLDRTKTGAFIVAGVTAAAIIVVRQFRGTGGKSDIPPPSGGPAELVGPRCSPGATGC